MPTPCHASAQDVPLLITKLHISPLRTELVSRPRLMERFWRIIAEQQSQGHQLGLQDEYSLVYPAFEVHNVKHYEVFKNAEEGATSCSR